MASGDARPVPRKNVAYRITFEIYDADGDLVTGAAGLDSEVSKDGGAFADCTNEATEIGSSGVYTLDLTSTEMNADTVAVIVKTSTVGAKTRPVIMYPEEAGDIRVNVTTVDGDAQSLADLKDFADAGYDPATNKVQGVVLVDTLTTYTGNTPQTGDSFARIGANGAGLSAVPWNAAWDAEVQSEAADALVAYDPPTRAEATSDKDEILAGVAAVGAFVDTEVAAIIAALGTVDGKIDIIDGIVDSITARLPAALVDGRMASIAQVVGDKTGYALTVAEHAAVADKLLGRTRAGGADGGRTVSECLAMGRNKSAIAAGVLTVYADDDATPLWAADVTTAPGDPITGIDPQ